MGMANSPFGCLGPVLRLADLEQKNATQIVGGMYDLATGLVEFVPEK
jgi:hypothetical protein